MTLKELKDYVNRLPSSLDDAHVVCQIDPEGNGYRSLRGVDEDSVCADINEYEKEVYHIDVTAEDNCMEEDEWEALKNDPSKRCIVLFP